MARASEFPVRRRTDGSIDTRFYRDRAERLHKANFAKIAKWLMRTIRRSKEDAMKKRFAHQRA